MDCVEFEMGRGIRITGCAGRGMGCGGFEMGRGIRITGCVGRVIPCGVITCLGVAIYVALGYARVAVKRAYD